MPAWVIGRGGLLGHEIAECSSTTFAPTSIPWSDDSLASAALLSAFEAFKRHAADRPWTIYWAAGAAVVSSTASEAQRELATLEVLLGALSSAPPSGPGAFFLASSAGGAYAGSRGAPFTSVTTPHAVSSYGELKLQQEQLADSQLRGRTPLVIGRIANLYGWRQNRLKSQGLVYHLCRASVHRKALNLYVPMETLRDYVASEDAARAIVRLTEDARDSASLEPAVHVIATGNATSVASLIGIVEAVGHRKVPIALGRDRSSRDQAIDLRLSPSAAVLRALHPILPLPVGVRRTFDALVRLP